MKTLLGIFLVVTLFLVTFSYLETKKDPYEEGMHLDYSIICENGFVYKQVNRGTIQVFNSDGTPLKKGHKTY